MSAGMTRRTASSTDGWLRALQLTSRIGTQPQRILASVIEENAALYGDQPALFGDGESLTYRGLGDRQRHYAMWALQQGLQKGETVALLMANRPEYLAIWLGLTQVGIVVALLNTNLTGTSLAHCIAESTARHAIVAADRREQWTGASIHLSVQPVLWVHGEGFAEPRIDVARAGEAEERSIVLPPSQRPSLTDRALLIYTSGTTGLPKAAHVSHHRLMTWSFWFAGLLDIGPEDRIYDCLPLYHSIGGVVATGSVLVVGGSVVIRERFSASRFWDDVVTHECTLFQYIGELCRYLVNSPQHPREQHHRLRACAGNGLRADVWEAFQSRFAVPTILEFYAATEGTLSLYNVEGRRGAVGRVPPFMAHRSPAALVAHDLERGEPSRDVNGRCVRVPTGTTGELIGRLSADPARAAQHFEGYTNAEASAGKVLRDVFAPGDAWMRTGDLMRQDDKGFFFFVDRIGDTFRWKGENVATTEVSEIVSRAPGVEQAVVYGVSLPGTEGRAGMAAISVAPWFDLPAFRSFCIAQLPTYARPVFLRLCDRLETTETFKLKKAKLVEDGFDPARVADALFVDDAAIGEFIPIDTPCWAEIVSGERSL